jgi:tRNA dimethylallyltransferase
MNKKNNSKKIIVILGPTASGKSDLAVKMALKFGGEIISADSRQVYKGMNIGTGKITKKEMKGAPHHLLDVASSKKIFTVAEYKNLAEKTLNKILKRKKIPIICGGTAFYIRALIDGITIPEVAPDWKLRKSLEKKSAKELYYLLKRLDPKRATTIDAKNPRRLIRAIEIVKKTGAAVPELKSNPLPYPVLFLGVKKSGKDLKNLIAKRLEKRLKQGMVAEVKKLHNKGLSWKRIEEFGLEYRCIAKYLQNKMSYNEMREKLQKEIEHFAKRQMIWWKYDKRIKWVKNPGEAEKSIKKFISKRADRF